MSMTPHRRTQRLAMRAAQRSGQHSHPVTACHACARTAASSLHSSERREHRGTTRQPRAVICARSRVSQAESSG